QPTAMPALTELLKLEYTSRTTRCGGCANHCMLTVNHFPTGRHITGNRCEKGLGAESAQKEKAPNLYAYKLKRIFDYDPLPLADAPRGEIGIPRVLNMYERYPFWAVFFRRLGFRTVLSPLSRRSIYELGMESIPSESECYPAKLAHGHVQWLIDQGVKSIFHPCVYYEQQETDEAQNHYNCPIVISYAENLKNNVEAVSEGDVRYLRPFMAFTNEKVVTDRLIRFCHDEWGISSHEIRVAAHEAWLEQQRVRDDIRAEGRRALEWMRAGNRRGIVLAGRPYHIDPEINHGIPELITSYGLAVLSEDSLDEQFTPVRPVRVNDQWVYHSRLYTAAQFVCKNEDLELIQLNSFGCGLDAVTTDQIAEILEQSGKLYTCLKIDEISNLGAVRIRLRSLLAAMNMRRKKGLVAHEQTAAYRRVEYSAAMQRAGYTILCPQMSPIHFNILEPIFRANGYNLEVLNNDNRTAIDTGLKFVNNDACFPSITVVGQIMEAVLSGRYDTSRLAIIMSQTGGCCRASNYIAFIRRALSKVGQGHIPVISLNANGMETNEGFRLSKNLLLSSIRGIVCGDLLMRCLYRMRPYELTPGSANALHKLWEQRCIESLTAKDKPAYSYKQLCRGIVEDFDALPIDESVKKPRVGIVGEILVKFLPLANNHLVELLEREGAEAVVPDLLSFFSNAFYSRDYLHKYLGTPLRDSLVAFGGVTLIEHFQKPGTEALRRSK
ncbi:MAG: 2-hydroxyacyl-CoA dehydratase, partial [Oscillospiraceae bacterium]|nr:2-hydroxyacyl-CoA dehydratase [Oscillospiraceae bacterium]